MRCLLSTIAVYAALALVIYLGLLSLNMLDDIATTVQQGN